MKEFAQAFYKSRAWRDCRKAYKASRIQADGGLCEVCHEALGYIVHHKIQLTPENINDPSITLNPALLSYECKACHDGHDGHGLNKSKPLRCAFDPEGQPVIFPGVER